MANTWGPMKVTSNGESFAEFDVRLESYNIIGKKVSERFLSKKIKIAIEMWNCKNWQNPDRNVTKKMSKSWSKMWQKMSKSWSKCDQKNVKILIEMRPRAEIGLWAASSPPAPIAFSAGGAQKITRCRHRHLLNHSHSQNIAGCGCGK